MKGYKHMKRIRAILLTILTVTAVFASCSRRDQFRPTDTDAPTGEQTTVAGQPDVNNPGESNPTDTNQSGGDVTDPGTTTPDIPIGDPSTGDAENGKITGNPYEGWTAEELYASFMEDQERSIYNNVNESFGNTPYYVILDVQYGGYMFSKLTGQVMQICKDPICDHTNCVFNNHTARMRSCQVVDDRIYMVLHQARENKYVMYSFDLLMSDAKMVCEWSDFPQNIHVYQDKVYYITEMMLDNGQYGYGAMTYDMTGKTTAPLWARAVPCYSIGYDHAFAWYTPMEDGSLHRYNLDTGEDEVILSGDLLNRVEGEVAFRFLAVSNSMVYFEKWIANGNFSNFLQYDMEAGGIQDLGVSAVYIYNESLYVEIPHDTDSNRDDPHYDYYFNNSFLTKYAGRVFEKDANTGKLNIVVQLCTDGIPDCIVNNLFMDGHFVIIEYQTYKDFNNHYSPSLPGWAKSRRYVVVELETGVAYELGVDLSTQSVHKQ